MSPEAEAPDPAIVPKPDKVTQLDRDESETAFARGMDADLGIAEVSDPSKKRIRLVELDGERTELCVTHNPLARLFVAMSEHHDDVSYREYFVASFRTLARGRSGKLRSIGSIRE